MKHCYNHCLDLLLRLFNPFVPNAPFLYSLKTENHKFFWCFQEVEKGALEQDGLRNTLLFLETYARLHLLQTFAQPFPEKNHKSELKGIIILFDFKQ